MKRFFSILLTILLLCSCGAPKTFADSSEIGIFGFKATSGDGKITLSWDAVDGEKNYNINWKRSSSSTWKIVGAVKKTSVNVIGLNNGINYDFMITAGDNKTAVITISPSADKKIIIEAEEPEPEMGYRTTMEFVKDMGVGINLGNTFDCSGDWFAKTPEAQETAWGSPVITEEMIKGYAEAGFGVMRLPVSWTVLADKNGNIPKEFMDRIEEVVGWILDSGMCCILNSHHDGWPEKFTEDFDGTMKIYENIWKQISKSFKNYGEGLMFESMNEVGFDDIWNQYGGSQGKDKAFEMFNEINQKFVDTVRSSGANNEKRHLLIASYWTSIDHACCDEFKMPDDPEGRCAISVHYYGPSTLCLISEDVSWGKARTDWGSKADYDELNKYMDMMKENYSDKGIGVIIGEYGCFGDNKTREVIEQWTFDIAKASVRRGFCPILWDTPGGEYDRINAEFVRPEFITRLVAIGERAE